MVRPSRTFRAASPVDQRRLLSSADARWKLGSSGRAAVWRNVEPSGFAEVRRKVAAVAKQLSEVMEPSVCAVVKQLGGALAKQLDCSLTEQSSGAAVRRKVVEVAKRPGGALEEQSACAAV
ncbi:hypothetical protein PI124_g22929 [Phytophthora idaei]|nr:hypothetical protein PI124_g22929 [Phytophthora idaei]